MNDFTEGNWQCSYCQCFATIRNNDLFRVENRISIYKEGDLSYVFTAIVCPNGACQKLNARISIHDNTYVPSQSPMALLPSEIIPSPMRGEMERKIKRKRMDFSWNLLPTSKAKIFPEYIPKAILNDYEEAYEIINLSPKASATLSRRCLQTIIRDFWGINNKKNLSQEIDALLQRPNIDSNLISAFHALREIGNMGAHMEKDTSLIIDVSPEEAEELIKFIENLIGLTYVEKYNRELLFKNIKNINAVKKHQKNQQTIIS